ncbi:hypothetical protein RLEG3_12340 [Rhizobium leguminosarum bv. trifolii WSM1689]|uniref:hypothetical protein n=1 Tax=Rhizobium leguminosarum TaxID=384 RepID=UPI0003E09E42|nr:hypothetical protein [Rhizobium leguminosarum]AHF86640.1 hypothetical protein RLEG3_12340 [Rhizobium leguminosarum bv. trifolii WSM1689]
MVDQDEIDELTAKLAGIGSELAEAVDDLTKVGERVDHLREQLAARLSTTGHAVTAVFAVVTEEVRAQAATLDAALDKLNEQITAVAGDFEEDALQAVDPQPIRQAASDVDEAYKATAGAIEVANETFADLAEQAEGELTQMNARLTELGEKLSTRIQQSTLSFREALQDAYIGAIEEKTEAAVAAMREAATEQIVEHLATEGEKIGDELASTLDDLLNELASKLREFLAQLREQIRSDDARALAGREELTEALDALEQAIPPMQAAFQAFSALAGSVGMSM